MSGKQRMSLPAQMGIGMVLGVLAGALAPHVGFAPQWFKPFGQLFINLVRMVVVPLVFATLVAGAASVGDVGRLGRVAGKTLIYYFTTTAIAIFIGLVLANLFQPGMGLDLSTANLKARDVTPPSLTQVLLNIVPINPMESLAKGSMLQIIFFAVLLGFSLSICGERVKVVTDFFNGMGEVMIRVTTIVMFYAPIGVFALMAFTVASHGLSVLLPLIMITMVFTQVGIPLEAIALVAGVDRIMDMARTTINVMGDATGAIFVSRLENDMDPARGAAMKI